MLPGAESLDDILPESAADSLNDDLFLPLATTTTGRTVNKFQPKPRGKMKKTVTAISKLSDSEQLRTSDAKQEVSMTQENLVQDADVSSGIEALDDHVQIASATGASIPILADSLDDFFLPSVTTTERTVNMFQPKPHSKTKKPDATTFSQSNAPESDIGSSEPNLVKEPTFIMGEVPAGVEDPHVVVSDASMQTVPAKIMTQVSTEIDMEGDPLFHPNAIGIAGTIRSSSSTPMNFSSQVDETNEPSNVTKELFTHEVASQIGYQVSKSEGSLETDPNKSEHDATPVLSGMESLDDILKQHSDVSEVKQVSKFQPKCSARPKERKVKSVSFSLPDAAETPSPVTQHSEVLDDDLQGTESPFVQMMNEELPFRTPHSTSTVSGNVDFQLDHGSSRNEDLADTSGLESFDSILYEPAYATGQTARKFRSKLGGKPKCAKPKIVKPGSSKNTNVAEEYSSLGDSLRLDTEQSEAHNLSIPASPPTNMVNEPANPVEMSSLEVGSPEDDDEFETIDIPMDGDTGNKFSSWNDDEQNQRILDDQTASKSFKEHGSGKPLRKSRRRITVDSTKENLDCGINENLDAENSNVLQMDEDNNHDECRGEDMPKQKGSKRSKRQMTDAQRPKRRKKASKEPDSTETEPPKKRFPHGTRRKRRQVDKVLLETPEDELDRSQLAFRDLIMLAEVKERISSKEPVNLNDIHSNTGAFSNYPRFDHDNPYDEDFDPDGDEAHRNMLRNSRKLNYGTYMNMTRSRRWSKSETALFYEAIRQFGTDFEMIVQLFPNRTRSQVKSKFKTEERKHPSEVRDAMIHRSKDHSHFERVIQQLQAQAEDSRVIDANDDPAITPEEGVPNGNQEERDQTKKEELGESAKSEKRNEWDDDDDYASLDLNEYENCDWDDGTSSFQQDEKYSEYDELF